MGLPPQHFSISSNAVHMSGAIVAVFAIYIGLKWSLFIVSFRQACVTRVGRAC
jgi:hypothetical protein